MSNRTQQAPSRNANLVAASVYSHSGEFAPDYTDLRLPGRELHLEITRNYRSSLADQVGALGRGWSLSIAKKILATGNDLVYHNGAGEIFLFIPSAAGEYASPPGFYGTL